MNSDMTTSSERTHHISVPGRRLQAAALLLMLPWLLPAGALAGTIPVTSNGDDNTPTDNQITLREALMIARGDRDPRVRGYGLPFLFLAGVHPRIAYQHLLGLIGLVLLPGGAPVEDPLDEQAEASPPPSPAGV